MKKYEAGILIVFLMLLMLALNWSCKSPEKAIDYLKKKDALSKACADNYPVKETVIYKPGDTVTNVIETPGVTITKTDTIYSEGKVIYKTSYIQCPPSKETTKLIHDTVMTYVENTARIAQLHSALDTKNAEVKKITEEKDKYEKRAGRWWIWLLVGAGLMFVIRIVIKYLI
jgi:hypothetical protein